MGEKVATDVFFDNFAIVDEYDARSNFAGEVHFVGDDNHGDAGAAELADKA